MNFKKLLISFANIFRFIARVFKEFIFVFIEQAFYDKATFTQFIFPDNNADIKNFLTITPITKNPKLNERVDCDVYTTEDVSHVFVQVYSKQLLRDCYRIDIVRKFGKFCVQIRFGLTPTLRLLAFYIAKDGTVIGDSIKLNFREELSNTVRIQMNIKYFNK